MRPRRRPRRRRRRPRTPRSARRRSATSRGEPAQDRASAVRSRLPALESAAYRRFLAGVFVANVGAWLQGTAQGWLVLRLTDSPAALGLTWFASAIPTLLLSLYAGILADRIDRRKLLLRVQIAVAVLAATLALLVTVGAVQFWHILLIAFLAGSASALGTPAFQALVPSLAGRHALGNAIALNSAQFNLARILGPAFAGVLVAAFGEAPTFWINALAALAVVVALASIAMPPDGTLSRQEAGLWSNLVDGLRYVAADRVLLALLVLAAAPALFVLPYLALMPVFARDVLGIGAAGLGLLTASVGVGALSGAIGFAVLRPRGAGARVILSGLVAMAIAITVFALSPFVLLSCVALAFLGASQVAYYTGTNTLIQLRAPGRLRGRILSLYVLTSIGLLPVGSLVAGSVAQGIGAPRTLAIGGALTIVAMLGVVVWCRDLPRLRAEPATSAA